MDMSSQPDLSPRSFFDRAEFRRLYPFTSRRLPLAAGQLHYVDEGPRGAETLLMLHGNPTWSFFFRALIRDFSTEHRVVALDHLGCGLSDKPQDFDYCLQAHIQHVECAVDALGLEGITLVVHDWGGAIGMGFAVRRPELIRRLVILNTAAFPSPRMPASIALCRVAGLGPVLVRGLNGFARGALWRCVKHRSRLTYEIRRAYLAPYDDWRSRIALLRFVQDIPMDPGHPSYALLEAIGEGLAQFNAHPALIAWGGRDFVFDRGFFEAWRTRLPKARAVWFEDAGHYVLEDAHERIVPLIRALIDGTPVPVAVPVPVPGPVPAARAEGASVRTEAGVVRSAGSVVPMEGR